MTPNKELLLEKLPPYQDRWVMIREEQDVSQIISEILNAHEDFSTYYDDIALYFDAGTIKKICTSLYMFCKENLEYIEESEQLQTTSTPSGLLTRGYCDCKGYASFCAGILDAIKRLTGKQIIWYYRFASYNALDRLPHHVFVVVKDQGKEIWIDPTPGADKKNPSWVIDKTVKTKNTMPLLRNIAGLGIVAVEDYDFSSPMVAPDGGIVYPDTTPTGEVVPVEQTFVVSEAAEDDNELPVETRDAISLLMSYGIVDADGNFYEQNLFALQDQLSAEEFQRLAEARYHLEQQVIGGFFKNVFRGFKKVGLAVPRNAYLSLVALNVFGTATKVAQAISTEDGKKKLGDKWYKLGGNPDKLFNAARSGAKKKRILGINDAATIGAAPAIPAWVVTATAIIAAMTPLINSILNGQKQTATPYIEGYDPNLAYSNGYGGTDFLSWIKSHPLETAGIGLLIVLAIKKFSNKRSAA
jgi:hypothetical protein